MIQSYHRLFTLGAAALLAAFSSAEPHAVQAKEPMTAVYIAPSLNIPYRQLVAYGLKTQSAKLVMRHVEFTSENSPGNQMNNINTALTRGVGAVVIGPVRSISTPPVLRLPIQCKMPIAFTGTGPDPGQPDYTPAITANNHATGKAEGNFADKLVKDGGDKVGMLSMPLDRENGQKYLKGAKEFFAADGCDLVQIPQTHGLTLNEAAQQATDLLTAHPEIKAICGMYDEAAPGAVKTLQTRGLIGKIGVGTADVSPITIKLLRDGSSRGLFLQEAVGQSVDATQQVYNALTAAAVGTELPLAEPLVTKDTTDSPKAQATIQRAYPPSAGAF